MIGSGANCKSGEFISPADPAGVPGTLGGRFGGVFFSGCGKMARGARGPPRRQWVSGECGIAVETIKATVRTWRCDFFRAPNAAGAVEGRSLDGADALSA